MKMEQIGKEDHYEKSILFNIGAANDREYDRL